MTKEMDGRIVVSGVLLWAPQIFTAAQFKEGQGSFRYAARIIVEPGTDSDKKIRKTIVEVARKTLTSLSDDDVKRWVKKYMASIKDTCYKEDERRPDKFLLSCSRDVSKGRPATRDKANRPVVEEDGLFYGGCKVNLDVSIWVQNKEFKGIRCEFNGIQFVGDGERLGGTPADGALFDSLPDEEGELYDDELDDLI